MKSRDHYCLSSLKSLDHYTNKGSLILTPILRIYIVIRSSSPSLAFAEWIAVLNLLIRFLKLPFSLHFFLATTQISSSSNDIHLKICSCIFHLFFYPSAKCLCLYLSFSCHLSTTESWIFQTLFLNRMVEIPTFFLSLTVYCLRLPSALDLTTFDFLPAGIKFF